MTVTVEATSWPSEAVLPWMSARMARMVAWVVPQVPSLVFCFEIQLNDCLTVSGQRPALITAVMHSAVVFNPDLPEP